MNHIEQDRSAQLVMASNRAIDYAQARRRLDSASLHIKIGPAADTAWGQVALLVAIACASRMFARGVFVEIDPAMRCLLPLYSNRPLARVAKDLGAQAEDFPKDAVKLQIGTGALGNTDFYCLASGWSAHISHQVIIPEVGAANELSGAFAAALAVASAFRFKVLGDAIALRRPQSINLWEDAPSSDIEFLPTALRFIGLGNLGQAALLLLSMLPYRDAADILLLLQDPDTVGPENISVQLLTRHSWVGQKKARAVADWAERFGFQTAISERLFKAGDGPDDDEPQVAIVGVDNLKARRLVASAPFSLVVDAGLGATGSEAFDIRLHAFPGSRAPEIAWPEIPEQTPTALPAALEALVAEGAISLCGAMSIAGKAVGVPCTAVAAGVLQLTQVIRAIADAGYADIVDLSLRDTKRTAVKVQQRRITVPFQRALKR